MKSNVTHISDVLDQDGLINDFSFNQILRKFEYELKMISYCKRGKKSKRTFSKLSYLAGM